jgi:hypothetical protein
LKRFLQLTRLIVFVPVALLAVFGSNARTSASSDTQGPTTFTTVGADDFYFELEAGTTFTIRATAQQYGIDSMFWLYDSNNQLLAANDDFYGLDSYISYNVQETGIYRLRTGVCCGDPNRWYGTSYLVESGTAPTNTPPTTTTSTTTTSTTTTTTTLPPLGMRTPTNLQAFAYEGRVSLSWDAPEGGEGYAPVERYAIFFTDDNWQTSRAVGSTNTWATVYNLENGTEYQFRVRADNDTLGVYSSTIETFTVSATPVTTTTTSTTTTSTTTTSTTTTSTIPEPTPTSVFVFPTLPPADTEEPVETPPSQSDTESDEPVTSVPQYAEEQEKPAEEAPIEVPQDTQDSAVADIFDEPISEAKLADAVENLVSEAKTPEELVAVVNSLLDQKLTDEQFSTVIDSVFSEPLSDENFSAAVDAVFADVSELSDEQFDTAVQAVFDEPLTTEQFSAALDAVFDEPISDEKFDAIIDAVLDAPLSDEQFEELVGVLESDTVTEEQVAAAVDSVIENGVTEEQATDLATSAKVLESIDGEQATEIFAAVEISAVTPEEAAQLVEAVQDAPTEVREALESEVNIFQGAIDTYVPLGSSVPIGTRRVIIGASALAIFSAPVPVSRRN